MTLPGSAVGAGFAFTEGVKEPTDFFSVGDGVGAALLSEGAFVSAGLSLVVVLHAVNEPMPTIAAVPATTAIRRDKRDDHIVPTPCFPAQSGDSPIIADARRAVEFRVSLLVVVVAKVRPQQLGPRFMQLLVLGLAATSPVLG